MKRISSSLLACCVGPVLVAVSSQAFAAPATVSNRAAPAWTFSKEQTNGTTCVLATQLAPASPYATATISPAIGGRALTLALVGPRTNAPPITITAGYQIGNGPIATKSTWSSDTISGEHVIYLRFEGEEAAALSAGAPLSFAVSRSLIVNLNTLGLWGGLAAAEVCAKKRYIDAGVTAETMAAISDMPAASMPQYFNADDYPRMAIEKREQGTVEALAMIKPSGKVSSCRVIETSKSMELDRATCNIIKDRARFKPALDRAGKPVQAPSLVRIRWALPD